MISRNLSGRIERLERQLRPRIKDVKASDIELIRRLNEARRRMALEGDERYAVYKDLVAEPEGPASHATEIVMILKAARKRMNQQNEIARQTAGTAATMEQSEIPEA
jgi:uncharacterized protein YhaN